MLILGGSGSSITSLFMGVGIDSQTHRLRLDLNTDRPKDRNADRSKDRDKILTQTVIPTDKD